MRVWAVRTVSMPNYRRTLHLQIIQTAATVLTALAAIFSPLLQGVAHTVNENDVIQSIESAESDLAVRLRAHISTTTYLLQKVLDILLRFDQPETIAIYENYHDNSFSGYAFIGEKVYNLNTVDSFLFDNRNGEQLILPELPSFSTQYQTLFLNVDDKMSKQVRRIIKLIKSDPLTFSRRLGLRGSETKIPKKARGLFAKYFFHRGGTPNLEDATVENIQEAKKKIYQREYVFQSGDPILRIERDMAIKEVKEILKTYEKISGHVDTISE